MANKKKLNAKAIRKYVVEHVESAPADIAKVTAQQFGLSITVINEYIDQLVEDRILSVVGTLDNKAHELKPQTEQRLVYDIDDNFNIDTVWQKSILPLLSRLPQPLIAKWRYGIYCIIDNVLVHAESKRLALMLELTPIYASILIHDRGIGIFSKICEKFGLSTQQQAINKLQQGAFSTDPQHHKGEGLYFTRQIFDEVVILSKGQFYYCGDDANDQQNDWVDLAKQTTGTLISLKLYNDSTVELAQKLAQIDMKR